MHISLEGKKALVTGSTAGIGRAAAEGLVRAGASVVINGRGQARVDDAVAQIRRDFPQADVSGVVADLSTLEGVEKTLALVPDVDILVNNVGTAYLREYSGVEDIANIPDEDWLNLFHLNVMSGVRLTRHYLPRMSKSGWGRVVFVSSESALNPPKEMLDYGMTKTAQLAVSRGFAEAVAGSGVTVNAILPGPTRSEILGDFVAQQAEKAGITQEEAEQEFLRTLRPTTLIKRLTTTEEVANLIVYTCSEQAAGTTGASLRVDGGVVRSVA